MRLCRAVGGTVTHRSVLQQVLQSCCGGGAVTTVLLFHVLLHFLHLVLSFFDVGKELQGEGITGVENKDDFSLCSF